MTKKDYERIASVFPFYLGTRGAARDTAGKRRAAVVRDTAESIARDLATELWAENKRFNTEKFLRACGLFKD